MDALPNIPISIRTFHPVDTATCKALYLEGLIGGSIAPNDTGSDIEDIQSAYLNSPGSHFWVATTPEGAVVGMIGVQQHDEGVGEIRRLRVARDYRRRGIGSQLVETAVRFCQERGYLKIKLDTFVEADSAVRLFERFQFLHDRTRTVGDKQLMYFYLDLYSKGNPMAQ